MLFCFVLSDDFALLQHKIEEISNDFFQSSLLSPNKHTFWADEGLSNNFWQVIQSSSLDPKADLVLLRHAELLDTASFKALSEALGILRENVLVILCIESAWEKNAPKTPIAVSSQKCFEYAKKKGWYFPIAPLTVQTVEKYIAKGLLARSINADIAIQKMLAEMLPLQASSVENTLDQLALAVGDKPLEEKDLYNIASSTPEVMLFDFVKHLEAGRMEIIWSALLHESKAEDIFFGFLSMLTREARVLWQILHNDVAKLSWVNDKKRSLAFKLGKRNVATLFSILSEADWSIKSGRKTVAQAMEELLFRLSFVYKVN